MLRFERTLAFRHLRSGGGQTLLTVSAVAAGVIVIIFIAGLIFGLRRQITGLLTDVVPHVTVSVPDQKPRPLTDDRPPATGGQGAPNDGRPAGGRSSVVGGRSPLIVTRIERQSQQRKEIENWGQVVATIRTIPEVVAVAPAVMGQGFISRGEKRLGVAVSGAEPKDLNAVTPVIKYVFAGRYLGLGADEVVISYKQAQDLGVRVGDRIRLTSTENRSESFLIAGIYDTGQDQQVGSRAYLTLRAAQSLYGMGTAVREILVKTDDLFHADRVADRIKALLPLKAESWSRQNPQLVAGLGAQQAVTYLVSGFSLVASAFAIASVLIVSVLQKSREIGILKSMGARRRQILVVFLLEGLGIALVGSVLGALLGSGLVWGLSFFKQPVTRMGGQPEPLLPGQLDWSYILAAMLAATVSTVLAAALPARRAASLDPVEVMR
jgi:lipoprotein-releasing system permease protein